MANLTIRMLLKGTAANPTNFRIQVTSDEDVQLYFQTTIEGNDYPRFAQNCGIEVDMDQFVPVFKSLLTSCQQKPWEYKCHLVMDDTDGKAHLKVTLENEFKIAEVISIPMRQLDDETISKEISFRINSNKQRTALVMQHVRDIFSILQQHNPAMIELLQRAVSGHDPNTDSAIHLDTSQLFDSQQGVKMNGQQGRSNSGLSELPNIM